MLVRPQLSENIGTAARAMGNCALTDMRLVGPKPDWLTDRAIAASSGADAILHAAKVFETTAEAVADVSRIYATTARNRFMVKPVVTPRECATELRGHEAAGLPCAVLFGAERSGLENDDVALADKVVMVPLNPEFASLNPAQAVLLVGYEWLQSGQVEAPAQMTKGAKPPADKATLLGFYDHLERELEACGFFRAQAKKPAMIRNIRNMFNRADLTTQEVRTLHGIVHELATWRGKKAETEG